uniref:Uncharacterized protein n=1 Tax=Tanacetum cinerariifolium TaxID=118510 RepID=A0A699I1F8_TANCI|nr:hypothetical protein [Tanacetum cinerariifolium]
MSWRHQTSSVADPSPTGVRAEDICRLCENIIDLRPVHPTMLYTIGLTTIWKHVGYHSVFKDGEGTGVGVGKGVALTANEVIPQHITLPLPFGSQILEKSNHQKVDGSPCSGFGTHHSVLPLNTIIPNEVELTTEGDGLILESVNRAKEDAYRHLDHVEDTTEVNFPLSEHLVLNTLTPPMRMRIT